MTTGRVLGWLPPTGEADQRFLKTLPNPSNLLEPDVWWLKARATGVAPWPLFFVPLGLSLIAIVAMSLA